jgi:hypothetical protein
VRRVVAHDHMHSKGVRDLPIDDAGELEELLVSMARQATPMDDYDTGYRSGSSFR